jgi:uncharacterized protein HemY
VKKIFGLLAMTILLVATPAGASILSAPKSIEEIRAKLDSMPPEHNYRQRASLATELGTQLYKNSRWDEAVKAFEEALSYGPPNHLKKHIYLYMAKSQESAGRADKAIDSYEHAVAYDKNNWRRHRDLAHMYDVVRLPQKSIAAYEKAAALHPREPSIHFALGRLWAELALYEKAEKNFMLALDNGYNQHDVFSGLSSVFEAQGKYGEAAGVWAETLSINSSPADWGRLVYLALLARNNDLVEKGMTGLKHAQPASEETLRFYESMRYYSAHGKTDNPALRGTL